MINLNDVLLAASNIPVDDPIAEIWGRQMQGGYKIIEYTGTLPITISANGDALIDYRIYGADGGVGEPTENLFDKNTITTNSYLKSDGSVGTFGAFLISDFIPVEEGEYLAYRTRGGYTGCYNCIYDENKNFLRSIYTDSYQTNILMTIGSNEKYIRISVNIDKTDAAMVVKGSAAPTEYEPYGYKLPMTVYKQEFVVTSDMLDQSNWTLSPKQIPNPSYFIYFDISDFISKEVCVAKIYENFSVGYTPGLLVVALTDAMYTLVGAEYRILKNNGVISNKEFDFSSWDKIYLCIGYGNGFRSDNTKQSKINELFVNWKILIAPVSQTQTVPVYIGENKLDAIGEYRDYVDFFSGWDSNVIFRDIDKYTFTGDETVQNWGMPDKSIMVIKLNSQYRAIQDLSITTRCSHWTAIANRSNNDWRNVTENGVCGFTTGSTSGNFTVIDTTKFTTPEECKAYLKAQYDNGTPVEFWYAIQPGKYDIAPVPFPEIPTIKGETVIDYDGDPKPSQMYVKYKGKG